MGYDEVDRSIDIEELDTEELIGWIYDEGLLNMRYWLIRKDMPKRSRVGPWHNSRDAQLGLEAVRMVLAYWGISDVDNWVLIRDEGYAENES